MKVVCYERVCYELVCYERVLFRVVCYEQVSFERTRHGLVFYAFLLRDIKQLIFVIQCNVLICEQCNS